MACHFPPAIRRSTRKPAAELAALVHVTSTASPRSMLAVTFVGAAGAVRIAVSGAFNPRTAIAFSSGATRSPLFARKVQSASVAPLWVGRQPTQPGDRFHATRRPWQSAPAEPMPPAEPTPRVWTLCVIAQEKIGVPPGIRPTIPSPPKPGDDPVLLNLLRSTHKLRPARSKGRDKVSDVGVATV